MLIITLQHSISRTENRPLDGKLTVILVVDMLDEGQMGPQQLRQGNILMVTQPCLSIPEVARPTMIREGTNHEPATESGDEGSPIWSKPIDGLLLAEITDNFYFGYGSYVSQHTVHCTVPHIGLGSCRLAKNSCLSSKAPTMSISESELGLGERMRVG